MIYQFNCKNEECEKYEIEFNAKLAMSDIGKTELYPICDCCHHITEKVFNPNGAFALKGGNWFSTGYGYRDAGGRPTGNLVPLGTALKSSTAKK